MDLANPFSAGLKVTGIVSTVKAFGIPLGTISEQAGRRDDDSTSTDSSSHSTDGYIFAAPAHSTTTSPSLPLEMNLDSRALFTLTRVLAVEAGLDVRPLDGIIAIGGEGVGYLPGFNAERRDPDLNTEHDTRNLFTAFNLPAFVRTAFEQLKSDVELTAGVLIGSYATTLTYTQPGVPIATDDTLGYLLPVLARPVVQQVMDLATLQLESVLISDVEEGGFRAGLKGSIGSAGPFDAHIAFPGGLDVAWEGRGLGSIRMEGGVDVVGDVGANLDFEAEFRIGDREGVGEFAKVRFSFASNSCYSPVL